MAVERTSEADGTVPHDGLMWGVLGGTWLALDGCRVAVGRQSRFVLALLLRQPGRPVPVETIGADRAGPSDRAVAAGRMAVSRLRAQLAEVGADTYVDTAHGGYVIDVDPLSVDHVAFEQRVREADAIEWPDAALRRLDSALALWRGEPFGEHRHDEAFDGAAHALEELHRIAVDRWGDLVLRSGRHRESLSRLEAAVLDEPLRERRWASLVLAHYRSGNQTESLRQLERARVLLREQIGLEPGIELKQLAARVLAQDATLEWRPERQRARIEAMRPLIRPSVVLGRDREVDDVLQLVERHRVVTVTGFGGIGKSSLAAEIARRTARPVWVAALADVQQTDRVVRCIASAMGLASEGADDDLLAAIADHLEPSGLLVLDNCEHLVEPVTEAVTTIAQTAPSARVLATSRVDLGVRGAASYVLGPLAVGTAGEPGPAALIAADYAMIPSSEIEARWTEVSAICRQADGVPLALELLGAASASGAVAFDARDAVSSSVATALEALPDEARDLVVVLAHLPADAGPTLLERISTRDSAAVRRAVGFAVRAGLVVQRAAGDASRVRVLEPARDVIAREPTSPSLQTDVHRAVRDQVAASRRSLIDPIVEDAVVVIDDEHATVLWVLERLSGADQLDLVLGLGSLWRAVGRTTDGLRWLEAVRPLADAASPLQQARFWVISAQMSPSLATRVPFVEQLRWSMDVADREGASDVAGRAGAELAIGLGISGAMQESASVLEELDRRLPPGNQWAALVLAGLRAMGRGVMGDPVGAAVELMRLAREMAAISNAGAVSNLFLAVSLAQIAGDDALVERALRQVEQHPVDRFSAYSHAALRFERARFAVRTGDPDGGRLLWEALGSLSERGEHRPAEVCRRELGRWRVAHGDAGGVADLARAARALIRHDPAAAAVAVAALVTEVPAELDQTATDELVAAVPVLLTAPGGVPLGPEDRRVVERLPVVPGRLAADAVTDILHAIERRRADA